MARSYTWDYVAFGLLVLLTLALTFYSRFGGIKIKQSSKTAFSFAGGSVSSAAVLTSIARTGIGIRVFLGVPGEFYYHGIGMWEGIYGVMIALLLVSCLFMPVYFAMPTTSIYEYLELRFRSPIVRRLASLLYIIRSLLLLGVTTFTPCVALRAVLGLPYTFSIVAIGLLSITFTAIGGMRGVILNDVLQAGLLITCTVVIVLRAWLQLPEGLLGAFRLAASRGRLNIFNFNPDPTIRVATLSAVTSSIFSSITSYGCQQTFAQKYRSLPDERSARRTVLLASPVVAILETFLWVAGVAIFAVYADCDPLTAGLTHGIDEIAPFFVQHQFDNIPGLLGLYIGSLFCGSFGVAVAILNAVATVTWEDFLSKISCVQHLTDMTQLIIIRVIGALFGVMIMAMAFAVSTLPGLIEGSQLIGVTTAGPLLGVFVLALFCPLANKQGAICGVVASIVVSCGFTTGRLMISRGPISYLPLQVNYCPADINSTSSFNHAQQFALYDIAQSPPQDWLHYVFSITHLYFAFIGCSTCLIVGLLVSYVTGDPDEDTFDARLVHSWAKKVSDLFPGKPRQYLHEKPSTAVDPLKIDTSVINAFECITHF